MRKYDKIWVPSSFEESNATVHSGGKFLADCAVTKSNVIVLTVEELLEVYNNGCKRMQEVVQNMAAGHPEKEPSIPHISTYLQSKGIQLP